MFYVTAINRRTGHGVDFGPYETEAEANTATNAGRRRGGNVAWYVRSLQPPAEGGDPRGAFVVHVSGPPLRVIGPFLTSAAARAWRRKNKLDSPFDHDNYGHILSLQLEIDEATAERLWVPKSLKRRVWV
jgi:hypothetical protein